MIRERETEALPVEVLGLGGLHPGTDPTARLRLTNPGKTPRRVTATLSFRGEAGRPADFRSQKTIPAGGQTTLEIPYRLEGTGTYQATLRLSEGRRALFAAAVEFQVPALFAADFGSLVSQDDTAAVWWAEGTYKISRERPAPTRRQPEVRLQAAAEHEPFQVVLRPARKLTGVQATVDGFVGPQGARLAGTNAHLSGGYVNVAQPTDKVGAVGAWPDPLPPVDGPSTAADATNA